MKISLLKSLVAAFALCLAVPGQAAMGNAGSGGLPGVQQEVEEEVADIFSTPNATVYTGIYDYVESGHIGRESAHFVMTHCPSELYVHIQINNAEDIVSLAMRNRSTGEDDAVNLDADNGYWIAPEYLETNGGNAWFDAVFMCSQEITLSYTVSTFSSKDLNTTALDSSEHQIVFIDGDNYPNIRISESRISGDVNADIPFQVTVNAGGLLNQSGFQLNFRWDGNYEDRELFAIKGDGVTYSEDGRYIYSIPSLQSQTYTFTATATAECGGSVYVYLSDSEGSSVTGNTVNVIIPINYSQADIDALKAIAKANPLSTDLQKFIADKYYEKDYNYDDGYNVGVSWNTENPSRVREFNLEDHEDRVDTLDLSALTALERVYVYRSRIRTLDLSALPNLKDISLSNTDLMWTDVILPSTMPEYFYCSGYTRIEATGATPVDERNAYAQSGTQIDLSAYATVKGTQSTYQWYKEDRETGNRTEVSMKPGDKNGAFKIEGTPGECYYCEIKNPLYGDWNMETQLVKISRTSTDYSPIDTLALRKLAEDNPQVPQLKEFVDGKGWEHENWNTYSDAITTDWSSPDQPWQQ